MTLHDVWAEFTAELAHLFARFHSHPVVQAAAAAQVAAPTAAAPAPAAPDTGADNPALRAYLAGGSGNVQPGATAGAAVPDPYGDHNGSAFDQGYGYLRFAGDKTFTLPLEANAYVLLAIADNTLAVHADIVAPSGRTQSFDWPQEYRFTADEAGTWSVRVTTQSPVGTLKYAPA